MLNAIRLTQFLTLDLLRFFGCGILTVLWLVIGFLEADASETSLPDYLRTCGIGDDAFARFSDDRQIAEDELDVIRCLAVRLRDCPNDCFQRMIPQGISAAGRRLPAASEAQNQRGRVLALQGSLIAVERVEDPDAERLCRYTLALSDSPRQAIVYLAPALESKFQTDSRRRIELAAGIQPWFRLKAELRTGRPLPPRAAASKSRSTGSSSNTCRAPRPSRLP